MYYLISQVLKTFRKLFPKGKHRNRAIWLAAIATIVPLTQLFVIRIFTHMITKGPDEELSKTVINFTVFFGLFAISHLATYWQKTYRVKVFNDALTSREGWRSKVTESWDWALAFESNNLLHTFTQVIVLAAFFISVNWKAGLINAALILITMQFIRVMFKKQMETQAAYALAQKKKEGVENVTRIKSRIQSAEIGTLVANASFILSLAVLLILNHIKGPDGQSEVGIPDAVMLFLGFRMQNANLGQTSGSLMRFARAKANSEAPAEFRKWQREDEQEEMF